MHKAKYIIWHKHKVSRKKRSEIKGHRPCLLWFTGLPASGKSTIAHELERILNKRGIHTYVLDGDNIRHGLNKDLGFSIPDRRENIRRIGEVARLFVDAGIFTITAFISPFKKDRDTVRTLFRGTDFIEIYTQCPISVCMKRDPKGLYQKAAAGKIEGFTGLSHPYEEPLNPEIVLKTDKLSLKECIRQILIYLATRKIITSLQRKEGGL